MTTAGKAGSFFLFVAVPRSELAATPDEAATARYRDPVPSAKEGVLIELRGKDSQTLAPPSAYPPESAGPGRDPRTAERCVWHCDREPCRLPLADLQAARLHVLSRALRFKKPDVVPPDQSCDILLRDRPCVIDGITVHPPSAQLHADRLQRRCWSKDLTAKFCVAPLSCCDSWRLSHLSPRQDWQICFRRPAEDLVTR